MPVVSSVSKVLALGNAGIKNESLEGNEVDGNRQSKKSETSNNSNNKNSVNPALLLCLKKGPADPQTCGK